MTKKQREKLIEEIYRRNCSGIQIDIMDIGKVFKEAENLLATGLSVDEVGSALRTFTLSIARRV
jgi:hypothetical protein